MPSIDERVVSMAFENAKFEAGVAKTMQTLQKLEDSLKRVGANQSLGDIEKTASKVTLNGPMSAMDKLRAKFAKGTDTKAFTDIERAGNSVTLEGANKAIDKTQAKMDQLSAGSTFSDIEKASNQVELGGIAKAVSAASNQFSVLQGAAAVALGNITTQAIAKGTQFAKGFGVGPIIDGLHEYETNLQSIQTVQANTDQPLTKINKSLSELNAYSDQTIYNFSEMARNIGTFTAAGVDLKTATSSIKGIANMAALSGSTSQQAATAMYQLSQAIASGRVGLQDWNSVVNAGMGGKKLQNALSQTAIAMGDMKDSSVKLVGPMKKLTINGKSFRESIQSKPGEKPWLTSEVLVNTLATLDGRFSKAALSAELTANGLKKYTAAQVEAKIADNRAALEKKNGVKYTDAQFAALQKLSDSAFKSATEVKTLGQVFDVAKETIGSGWSASFQNIFGNLKEAKQVFTGMSNTINGFINKTALARNELLAGWKDMGGRAMVIQGIKNIFNVLFDVLGKVGHAFREIFPKKTSEDLVSMSRTFLIFTAHLNNAPRIIDNIARTFKGLFAVLHIVWSVFKGVIGVIGDLFGVVGKSSGGILNFTGSIADFLVAVDAALTKGGLLNTFFKGLTKVLKAPLEFIGDLVRAFFSLFDTGEGVEIFGRGVTNGLAGVKTAITPIDKVLAKAKAAWENFLDILEKVRNFLDPWVDQIRDLFATVSETIANAFSSENFDKTLDVIKTVLMGGLFLQLKKMLKSGFGVDVGGGALSKLGDTFDALTGHLKAMQKGVQASILLKIAAAIALLAASALLFSTIDPKRLGSALTAMAISLGQLVGAMALLTKTGGAAAFVQVPAIAVGMVLLAGALVILAAAAKIFATMDWEEIGKGLVGIGGGLVAIGTGMKFLGPSTLVQAVPLLGIAIALNLLAFAVKQFAGLSWEDIGKGLAAVGANLAIIGVAMTLFGPETLLIGPGLIAVSAAMILLSGAVGAFGGMDPQTLGKGIAALALALAAIGASLFLIPPTAALQGAGLIAVAVAMGVLGGALRVIGGMPLPTLAKGLVGMAAALVILGIGLYGMVGTLPGSAALVVAAAAFAVLGPAMAVLGNLDWGTIFKALGVMALTMGVLAVLGTVAAAPLATLGAALIVLGLGLLAITSPIYLFAKAIALLSDVGQKGVAVFLVALTGFVAILPKIIIDFVKGLLDIINSIAEIAPRIMVAIGTILDTVIAFVLEKSPDLFAAVGTFIGTFLGQFDVMAPRIIASGIKLLLDFLHGVSSNISEVVNTASDIVVKFLNGLTQNAPRLSKSGLATMLAFLSGISTGIPRIVGKVGEMVTKFLAAVTAQIPNMVQKGAQLVIGFINGLSSKIGGVIAAATRLIVSFITGLGQSGPKIIAAGVETIGKFIKGIASGLVRLVNIGAQAIIDFMNGIANAIRTKGPELRAAGYNVADAILDGIVQGFKELGDKAIDAVKHLMGKLPNAAKKVLGIKSPSREFIIIGKQTMEGFKKGVEEHEPVVTKSAKTIGTHFISAFKDLFGIASPSTVMREIGKQVGAGFKQGLEGSASDIRNSFRSLREKLTEEIRNARQGIKEENDKLDDLYKERAEKLKEIADLKAKKKPDKDAIKTANEDLKDIDKQINASQKAIGKYTYILQVASGARSDLIKDHQASKDWLVALSKELDKVTKDLDTANQKLQDIQRERADFARSTQEQFNKLPEINMAAKDPVADYKQKLKDQIEATKKFYATMMKLREQGLDDTTFRSLLSQGIGAQDFADQLSRSGERGIQEINDLDRELAAISGKLGTDSATALYKAGEDAAQGLVDGLRARQKELEKVMGDIADNVVAAIKKALGIKSPSRVLMEVGKFAATGLAEGFKANAKEATDAAAQMGEGTVSAIQKTMQAMSSIVDDNLNVDPTITPVLDLSQVQKEATKLSDLTDVAPITAAASAGQATAISAEQAATLAEAASSIQPVTQVSFEQNNYSPESLSAIDIYRQTKNQMGQLSSALGLPS